MRKKGRGEGSKGRRGGQKGNKKREDIRSAGIEGGGREEGRKGNYEMDIR